MIMDDNVKRQIGILIEQSGDPQHRAMLLVLMTLVDCLTENSKMTVEVSQQLASLKNQVNTNTIKRTLIVRTMDKVLPIVIMSLGASVGWVWSSVNDLQKFQVKVETEQAIHANRIK